MIDFIVAMDFTDWCIAGMVLFCGLVWFVCSYALAKIVHEAAEDGLDIDLPEVPHMPHIDGGD